MRLLVVEDEKGINDMLCLGFRDRGFAVDAAFDGETALDLIFTYEYDSIILDINLPLMNGLEVCKNARAQNINVPIIMLTAKDTINDKITGLDIGADDYLVKPFDFRELFSRVNALTRRRYNVNSDTIQINGLEINTKTRTVTYNGLPIILTKKEFDILHFIAYSDPSVVSLETIIEHCFDEFADPFSNSVRVHLSNLRRKLRLAAGVELIENKKGSGYYILKEQE
ncbi:response regulator transcription factor [Culicoidibacter larvae]|uniref:Response regulator transcription factor n=1 Tax=Culicoidibacter larvae TaxID=2579976 RepID=A0A5R8Q8F7_9FIRM|nr:response regulator transcription factor [Culicoidibacter larvae]TLG71781.1 response regulator transcription factor [Culicoidibacter larvae]